MVNSSVESEGKSDSERVVQGSARAEARGESR